MRNVGIVLAAGSGKRMNSSVKKQFMELCGYPIMYYSLRAMENSSIITDIIVVTSEEDIDMVREQVVTAYGFTKVRDIVAGGRERYHSVMNGIDAAGECDYIFIHDGARPMLTEAILERCLAEVKANAAVVAAVRSKDTVKIANTADYVVSTPNRALVWNIQTPQVFEYRLIKEAYDTLKEEECGLPCQGIVITDDACVVETFTGHKVKLVEGSYENIKVTTPVDLITAEAIIKASV